MIQTLEPKSATVALLDRRGSGRKESIQIAHQFNNVPPFDVELPSHLSLSAGKIALQTWVGKVYPKHIVVA